LREEWGKKEGKNSASSQPIPPYRREERKKKEGKNSASSQPISNCRREEREGKGKFTGPSA